MSEDFNSIPDFSKNGSLDPTIKSLQRQLPDLRTSVRRIPPNRRSVTGHYMSRRGDPLQFESKLEYDFFFLSDFEPATIRIIPQCPRVNGHVVDATIMTPTETYLVDVKSEGELTKKWSELYGLFSSTHNYAEENKLTYAFFTDAARGEMRNRLAVVKQVAACGRIESINVDVESKVLSSLTETTKVSTLEEKIAATTKSLDAKSIICRLIRDGRIVLLETPTQFLDDATVSLKTNTVGSLEFLIPFPRLIKRIETHPLRFMNGVEINYYNGMKQVEFAGHKYDVVDGVDPTNALIKSSENGEEYRVSLDSYAAAGGRLSAYAIQQKNDEQYDRLIQRIQVIRGLANLRHVPSNMLSIAGRLLDLSPRQVQRLLESYQNHGTSGLLPSEKRGGKGKHRTHKSVDELMDKVIEENYKTKQKKSVTETYRKLTKAIDEVNETRSEKDHLKYPNLSTLYNRINELDPRTVTQAREGSQTTDNEFAVFGGEFTEGKTPLELVEIDHLKIDLTIVDSEQRKPLGRLVFTGMVDTFSTCIPAHYLALKQPTANEVGIAITKCAMEKNEDVLEHGISEWPIHGIPAAIHFDNAKEFRAQLILAGCMQWRIHVIHRPVKNPRFGGRIERLFGTFQQFAHSLPGTTKSNPQEKGEYDSENESCLTFEEAETLILKFIDKYHHTPRADLGGMTPLEKWNQGVAEHGMPRQLAKEDEEKFRVSFLPAEKRTIQKDGVHFAGLKYFSDKLATFAREDARGTSVEQTIRYDPFDVRRIWILNTSEHKHYLISATDSSIAGAPEPISLRRWQASRRKLRRKGIGTPSPKIAFEQYKESQRIIENATLLTKKARRQAAISKREDELGKRFNRATVQEAKPCEETEEEFEPPAKDQHGKIRTNFRKEEPI